MIALIAAVAKNNCIGKNNQLPWNIPEDLQHFQKLTTGKTVLMGRKTFESIFNYLGKPLPKRKNLVITSNANFLAPQGVEIFPNIKMALDNYKNEDIFIIGGATIYEQTIKLADTLYITHIDKEVDGDAFFPDIDKNIWQETERKEHNGFAFVKYIKQLCLS